jgi:hypothetical protein
MLPIPKLEKVNLSQTFQEKAKYILFFFQNSNSLVNYRGRKGKPLQIGSTQ